MCSRPRCAKQRIFGPVVETKSFCARNENNHFGRNVDTKTGFLRDAEPMHRRKSNVRYRFCSRSGAPNRVAPQFRGLMHKRKSIAPSPTHVPAPHCRPRACRPSLALAAGVWVGTPISAGRTLPGCSPTWRLTVRLPRATSQPPPLPIGPQSVSSMLFSSSSGKRKARATSTAVSSLTVMRKPIS